MVTAAPPPRILIVDDEEAMREVLAQRLGGWGWETATAQDAADAREQMRLFEPSFVLSDVMLPDGSGLDVLRMVKAQRPECPVVLMTAHGTVDLAVDGMKGGAQDFLTKPIDYGRLQSILEQAAAGADPRAVDAGTAASWTERADGRGASAARRCGRH